MTKDEIKALRLRHQKDPSQGCCAYWTRGQATSCQECREASACPCNHCQKNPCTGKPGCTACFGTIVDKIKKVTDGIPPSWIAATLRQETVE